MSEPLLVWKQERPSWCPHNDCEYLRRVQDALCGGKLPTPESHDGDHNTHRMCQRDGDDGSVYDWQVNATDLDGFRWIFDALDGKVTSWRSKRMTRETAPGIREVMEMMDRAASSCPNTRRRE